jgi:hypothetical protein
MDKSTALSLNVYFDKLITKCLEDIEENSGYIEEHLKQLKEMSTESFNLTRTGVYFDDIKRECIRQSEQLHELTQKYANLDIIYSDNSTIKKAHKLIREISMSKAWLTIYPYRLMINESNYKEFDNLTMKLTSQIEKEMLLEVYRYAMQDAWNDYKALGGK